jgi:hypothetical protein
MGSLFSALSAKIFGGLAVALALFSLWQTLQLGGARDAIRTLQDQLTASKAETRLCSISVDAAKQLADERQKRADDLLAVARKDTIIHVDRATDILNIPTPTPDKECAATLQLLKDHQ